MQKQSHPYTFQCKIRNPVRFSKLVQVVRDFMDIITLEVSSRGIYLVRVDAQQVFLVELLLHSSGAFSEFECGTQELTINVKADSLASALRNVSTTDAVTLTVTSPLSDKLERVYRGSDSGYGAKESIYVLSQLTVSDMPKLSIPDRTYNAEVLMSAGELVSLAKDLTKIGETLHITVTRDEIRFKADSNSDMVSADVRLRATWSTSQGKAATSLAVSCLKEQSHSFRWRYFQQIAQAVKDTQVSEVLLQLSDNAPLAVSLCLDDASTMTFYLAPLIEE